MTLEQIKTLVISVDPNAAHYESANLGADAFTVWFEVHRIGLFADNHRPDKSWRFQIDRFTKPKFPTRMSRPPSRKKWTT